MNPHTPGPWRWEFLGTMGQNHLVGANDELVQYGGPPGSTSPDMELMAAAPELVAALRASSESLERVHLRLSAWRDSAHIAYKQTGSQDQYNARGNYDTLCSYIEPALNQARAALADAERQP